MVVAMFALCPLAGLAAPGALSQVPILNAATTKSNILIILDDSGSMGWGSGPPMKDAKAASIALLDSLANVRVGVGSFSPTWPSGLELDHTIVDLDTNRASLYKAINDLSAWGGTPLISSMQQAGRYFVGTGGPTSPGNSTSSSCVSNGQYNGKLLLKPGRTGEREWMVSEVFPRKPYNGDSVGSPICHWCQQNFIILLTDGWGWGGPSRPLRGRYCPWVNRSNQGCWHGLISVAKALNEVDLRPDIKNFKGEEVTNNVVTYTIGFHTSQRLLEDTANRGGGLYVEADDEASLKAAFAKIGEDILAHTKGCSSAPSFSTSKIVDGTTLIYLTRFDSEHWTGDVRAATFSSSGVGSRKWSAASLLDARSAHSRSMITYNASTETDILACPSKSGKKAAARSITRGGVPFRWDTISGGQLQDLMIAGSIGGKGSYAYEGKLTVPKPFDLAVDVAGDVFVANYDNHLVVKNSEDGAFKTYFGGSGTGDSNLRYPSGVATDSLGNVYVASSGEHFVKKYDNSGNFLMKIGGYDDLYYPFDVAVDSSGNIYVVELQNHQIKVFDASGGLLRIIGGPGSGDGQFKYPNRIAIDVADNLYVSDYLNHRIQKFDSKGVFDLAWGRFGTANGDFQYPYGIDTDQDGNVYVVEYKNRVQQFDSEGNWIAEYATEYGTGDGEVRYPRGIAVSDGSKCSGGKFFVADAYNNRVLRFSNSVSFSPDLKMGEARLDYLRGDRTNEGDKGYKFRERESLLGDIVGSEAVFVGHLDRKWPSGSGFPTGKNKYSKFAIGNKTRREVVYVGANDGMLHAFDANTGEELLAYLPGNLFTNKSHEGYHYLTEADYSHRFYVNSTPTVSDAYINSHFKSGKSWRTVLVGAQGAGGRGIFALDVTDPEKFKESMAQKLVLWEFTDEDDPQLGYTLARPTIALLPNGRWAAIFGNGYESKDPTGEAVLFIVFLDGGLDGTWTEGDDYVKISTTGVGSVTNRNGLSTPAILDVNGDSIADRVYAGDILGNMWAFDLESSNPNDWKKKYHRLFDTGRKQPITVRPAVTFHPTVAKKGNEPNLMVYFGTGQYLVPGDNTNTQKQNFYAVWDRSDYTLTPSDLVKQNYLSSGDTNGRLIDPNLWETLKAKYKGVDGGDRYGWYLDLPETGERVVTQAIARGKLIFFNTLVPNDPKPCSTGGGGWMMSVHAETGGSPKKPAFDFNMDGVIDLKGDAGDVPGVGRIGYAGTKYQGSGGVPTRSMIIGNWRVTAGTGIDDTSKMRGSTGGGGGGGGSGGSGSSGASGRENAVGALEGGGEGKKGRLSWSELSK